MFNQIFSDILQDFNLKSNITKTEHTVIQRGTYETELWRHVKKLTKATSHYSNEQIREDLDTKHTTRPISTYKCLQYHSQTSTNIQ